MAVTKTSSSNRPVRIGDRIVISYGTGERVVEVIEDRGPIGVGGRQLIRVKAPDSEHEFEVPVANIRSICSR